MDFGQEETKELLSQFTALVNSKFQKPYLDNDGRKNIDSIIFEIWKEIQRRKEIKEGD